MILNNQYYKKYFINLIKFLNSINFPFLYYIPSLFKRDLRKEFIPQKQNFNFSLLRNFNNDIYINKKNKIFETEVCFISHYVGIIKKKNLDYDFYYGNLFKELKKKKIKFSVILINHSKETVEQVYRKFNKSGKIQRVFS